jgi:hypothetical protein
MAASGVTGTNWLTATVADPVVHSAPRHLIATGCQSTRSMGPAETYPARPIKAWAPDRIPPDAKGPFPAARGFVRIVLRVTSLEVPYDPCFVGVDLPLLFRPECFRVVRLEDLKSPRSTGWRASWRRGSRPSSGRTSPARPAVAVPATLHACPPPSSRSDTRARSSNRWSLRSRPLGCPCSWIRARRRCRGGWNSGSGPWPRRSGTPASSTCRSARSVPPRHCAPSPRTIGARSRPATGSG